MDEMPATIMALPSASEAARRPTLTLDVALYEGYLAESDLDPVQKHALLDALWSIIVGFVDLGFAVEPAAGSSNDLGGIAGAGDELASGGPALVEYPTASTRDHFEQAAAQTGLPPEKWSSVRYGFAPCGGCFDASEEAYG